MSTYTYPRNISQEELDIEEIEVGADPIEIVRVEASSSQPASNAVPTASPAQQS
jgi:hypothetical protein